jgi:hypothetical protein
MCDDDGLARYDLADERLMTVKDRGTDIPCREGVCVLWLVYKNTKRSVTREGMEGGRLEK